MDQCVGLLQAQDRALRNNWKGHCGEDELTAELTALGLPDAPDLSDADESALEDGPCTQPLSYTPIAETALCGKASKTLVQHINERAVIRVKLPGGKCARFIPLLLTNKTSFACNAVQSYIACVDTSYDSATDTTSLVFKTERRGTPETATLKITAADVNRVGAKVGDLLKHPQFFLLPAVVRDKNVIAAIHNDLVANKRTCVASGRSAEYCEGRNVNRSNAFMLEWMRQYRNPRLDSPKPAIAGDARWLVDYMRTKGIDRQLEAWLLFQAIGKNEVLLNIGNNGSVSAWAPIFGVSDAVRDNSSFSFGAHQIDIGSGNKDVPLFWDLMSVYLASTNDPALEAARSQKVCSAFPLRFATVRALDTIYNAAPSMTKALRSDVGRNEYGARFAAYLPKQVQKTNAIPIFQKSMIARTLFSDVENQSGGGGSVLTIANSVAAGRDLASCAGVQAMEDAILDRMIWKAGPNNTRVHRDYHERYEHIRDLIRSRAPNGGRSNCS